ncbi:hypothetical protein K1T71_007818, partial [Dendrolimus kikuchii]
CQSEAAEGAPHKSHLAGLQCGSLNTSKNSLVHRCHCSTISVFLLDFKEL